MSTVTVNDGNIVNRAGRGKKIAVYGALILFSLMYVFPFFIQIATSFKTDADATTNPLNLIPQPVTMAALKRLADTDYPLWFQNSVTVTILVTIGRVFFCSLAGYAGGPAARPP